MKKIFIPVILKELIDKERIKNLLDLLPKNILIGYSIQYKNLAFQIKEELKEKKILGFMQVLGCSKIPSELNDKIQAILLLSDGIFHATAIAYNHKIPVYVFDGKKITKITSTHISEYKKKKKTSYLKFLNAKKIGILISVKPGQEKLEKAIDLKNSIKNKKTYLFIGNTFNLNEFENFKDIEAWINTACPRLDMESSKIINMEDIKGV